MFNRRTWYTLPTLKIFDTRNYWKKRVHPRKFRYFETKNIRKKNRDTPNSQKVFDTRTILKQRRVPLRIFSVLWDKKNSSKNRDLTLECLKCFRYPEIVKHFKVPPRNFCVSGEQRNWQKIVILLISKIFWYQDCSETHKVSPTKIFGAVR